MHERRRHRRPRSEHVRDDVLAKRVDGIVSGTRGRRSWPPQLLPDGNPDQLPDAIRVETLSHISGTA